MHIIIDRSKQASEKLFEYLTAVAKFQEVRDEMSSGDQSTCSTATDDGLDYIDGFKADIEGRTTVINNLLPSE